MNKLKQELEKLLKTEASFCDTESGEINYIKVKDSADKIDEKLISLLADNKNLKAKFFTKIKNVYVFNIQDFKFFLDESRIDNSYTKYANKIGLTNKNGFLNDADDVVLDFPFKDCVLEGGQSTEEGIDTYFEYSDKTGGYEERKTKRNEVFFNQVLAHDEIDRLFDKKALLSWKRYTKKGDKKVKEIKRDKNGTIKENLVIKGNNLLALHSLKSEFAGKIKLIYIDPPYNSGGDANIFTYNNTFNHSTWLTFMKNRLEVAKKLLREDGFIAIAIDHNELLYLGVLADHIFGRENRIGIISVVHKPEGRNQEKFFGTSNEFMLVYSKNKNLSSFQRVVLSEQVAKTFNKTDSDGSFRLNPLISKNRGQKGIDTSTRANRPKFWYPVYVSKKLDDFSLNKKPGYYEIYPVTDVGTERTWRIKKDTLLERIEKGLIVAEKSSKNIYLFEKYYENQVIKTHWIEKKYNAVVYGTKLLEEIIGRKDFSYPKSLYLVQDVLKIMTAENDIVLDFYAGSGTTGHATLELNKEDGGNRKFILIEQLDEHVDICNERNQKVLKKDDIDDSFIYLELAKWNEEAKEEIQNAKDLPALVKLFDTLYEKYFLNYNVKIKDFKEKIIKEEEFKQLSLVEQKKMFLAMLDLNQMYVNESEMADKKYGISAEDQKLTKAFYNKK